MGARRKVASSLGFPVSALASPKAHQIEDRQKWALRVSLWLETSQNPLRLTKVLPRV